MVMEHALKLYNKWCQIMKVAQAMHASGLETQSLQDGMHYGYTKHGIHDQDNTN